MRAGTLNRQIEIQSMQSVDDPIYGPQPSAWSTYATLWAQIQDVLPSRDESLRQGLEVATSRTRIRIRYREDITPDMRIVEQDGMKRILQIVGGPAILGNREGLELMCEKHSGGD